MSVVTPQTELRLLKCPIESDNRNQITFTNITNQYNYFNSLPKIEVDNFTYQRENDTIRYPSVIDDIREYNYVMYKNEAYSDKWFYAFITDITYVNGSMTNIKIATDYYQTYQFEIVYKPCFVEREHVNDDTVGLHTLPEGLETGEYTMYKTKTGYSNLNQCHIVMGSTANPATGNSSVGRIYGELYSGITYFIFEDLTSIGNAIANLNLKGKADAIQMLFVAPDELTNYNNVTWTRTTIDTGTLNYAEVDGFEANLSEFAVVKPVQIGNYTPKNKKVLCYPYQYFIVSNNSGENAIFKYEDFSNDDPICRFKVYGTISPGCSIRAVPFKYKHQGEDASPLVSDSAKEVWQEGITCGKFPQCNWSTDAYINWLTQNGVNNELSTASALIGGVGSALEASPSGLINNWFSTASALNERYVKSLLPDAFHGNINNGDVTYLKGRTKFENYPVQIREENARIIDEYFSMYGYKVNRLKIPNVTGRSNWNFVKTIGCNIEGNIPQYAIQNIKNMFDSGVTLWHKTNKYLDYSESNNII